MPRPQPLDSALSAREAMMRVLEVETRLRITNAAISPQDMLSMADKLESAREILHARMREAREALSVT